MVSSASSASKWFISEEEKSKHITLFYSLNPEDGALSGERCRELFAQSKLSPDDLSHIWRLSDIDGDGKLNVGEFTVAMHLIVSRVSSGRELPKGLPPSIKPCTAKTIPGITTRDYESYLKAFQQLDTEKRGYLSANEAKPLFVRSQLLTGHLAHVWNLSDYDHDGQLTVNEFVIATHLMRFLKAGNQLPSLLDVIALLPGQIRKSISFSNEQVETTESPKEDPAIATPPTEETPTDTTTPEQSAEAPTPVSIPDDDNAQADGKSATPKGSIKRGKWMTFSSKKPGGFFGKEPTTTTNSSGDAFGSSNRNVSPPSDDNPFASDAFVLDRRESAVSVTSLGSSTSAEPFEEDPFKESDPFQDPFKTSDPFVGDTSGGGGGNASDDPFSPTKDPFNDPFAAKSSGAQEDPFGQDPFAATATAVKDQDSSETDPFAPSRSLPTDDPFSVKSDAFEDSFASGSSSKEAKDPFAPVGSLASATEEEKSGGDNPFESDSFSSPVKEGGDEKGAGQHHVRFMSDSRIETTAETYSSEDYERRDSTVDPQRAEIEVIREEGITPKHGLDSIERRELDRIEREMEAMKDEAHVKFSEETDVVLTYSKEVYDRKDPTVDPSKAELEVIREEHGHPRHGLDDVEKRQLQSLQEENERKKSRQDESHVKFADSPTDFFPTYSRDEYERKDPNVDPLKAEIEIIREEHRKPRHGLDVIEKTELEKLEKEGEMKKSQEGHVKFSVSPDVYKTYGSDEYDRQDNTVDPARSIQEVESETGEKKRLVPHDSMTVLFHKKQQEEEKRREKEALQRQLMAEIDLEWEESEKKLEAETKESKEAAAKKAAAEIEAEKRKWQEKVKEREEAKAREEAKILEEAEKKAKAAFEEERKRIDEAKKDEQEGKIEEEKEEEKTPEAEPKIDAETTKEGSESKTETESPQKAGGVKGRRGLAARWEEAVAPTKESAASRKEREEATERRRREEAEILRRQQEFEEEQKKRAEELAAREQEVKKMEEHLARQRDEEKRKKEEERKRQQEKEEEERKAKQQAVPKVKKHGLARQWEEKFGAK